MQVTAVAGSLALSHAPSPTVDSGTAPAGQTPHAGQPTDEAASGSAAQAASQGQVSGGERATKPNGERLSEAELRQLDQLKTTDEEVRRHELAHQVAGGQYTGAASYDYQRGPDGQRYAVAGEVPIDYGPVPGNPRATIDKMQQVISAALAPAEPSAKDHQVAATARQYLLSAQLELTQQQGDMDQARNAGRTDTDTDTPQGDDASATRQDQPATP